MARLSNPPLMGSSDSIPSERLVADLTHLLARLERNILHTDQERERRLRASEFERARLNSVSCRRVYFVGFSCRTNQNAHLFSAP
jgi:hypothetical protein